MRTAKAIGLAAMLAGFPWSLLADNAVSPPNPVGEKLYYEFLLTHFWSQLFPGVLIAIVFLLAFLRLAFRHADRGHGELIWSRAGAVTVPLAGSPDLPTPAPTRTGSAGRKQFKPIILRIPGMP